MQSSEPKAKMRRIAIFGGSFNPPHICHQMIILYLLETNLADGVWVVPCNENPFKKGSLAPFDLRFDWCERLIAPFKDRAKVDGIEQRLGGISRTIDTMHALDREHPELSFSLVLGSDIRKEAAKWKAFDELTARYKIHWIGRANEADEPSDALILPDVSSSDIRARLQKGESVARFVPAKVLEAVSASGWRWKA